MDTALEADERRVNYRIQSVRFTTKQFQIIQARADALGLRVGTYMKLAVLKVTGANAAKDELDGYERRLAMIAEMEQQGLL